MTDKHDESEVIELEEYAKAGKPVPEGSSLFRIRIDREKYLVPQAALTGAELLGLAGKDPKEYRILFKCHGKTTEVELDTLFSFLKPGVERFMTQRRTAKEG